MKNVLPVDHIVLPGTTDVRAAMTLLFPFEPSMEAKSRISERLGRLRRTVADRISREMSGASGQSLMKRFEQLLARLNYSTAAKSVVLLLNAEADRIFYLKKKLQFAQLDIDNSVGLAGLLRNEPVATRFLLLKMQPGKLQVYLVSYDQQKKILEDNIPIPYSDFLDEVDIDIRQLRDGFELPLVLAGDAALVNFFSNHSAHQAIIVATLTSAEQELTKAMQRVINDWEKYQERYQRQLLEIATIKKRIAIGYQHVKETLRTRRTRTLILPRPYESTSNDAGNRQEWDQLIIAALAQDADVIFLTDDKIHGMEFPMAVFS